MESTRATKFYLLFNLAVADKKIDPKEYELLNKYYKHLSIEDINPEDIDFNSLVNLPKDEKSAFYLELVDMMTCDGHVDREELILCGMIGELMGIDPQSCIDLADELLSKESDLKIKIAKSFLAFVNEYDSNIHKPIKFINDFFKHEDIESQIKHMKILIFGSNEKISLNESQVIDLFNKTFENLELPGSFSSNNFSFYMDTYAKVKKLSSNVLSSVQQNSFDFAIIGSKPHYISDGFKGSWKENQLLIQQIGKDNIYENQRGFSKSYIKRVITQIGIKLGANL